MYVLFQMWLTSIITYFGGKVFEYLVSYKKALDVSNNESDSNQLY